MSDIGDDAAYTEALHLQQALAAARARAVVIPDAEGECLLCGEPTDGVRRWCSIFCRDRWQRENGVK